MKKFRAYFFAIVLIVLFPFESWSQQSDFTVTFDDSPAVQPESPNAPVIQPESSNTPVIDDSMRIKLIDNARKYLGVSYRYSQANENGFDCSGYVQYVYKNFGYSLPRSSHEQYTLSRHVKSREALPGDLIFFITRGKKISHVGIYLGNNQFIHSPGKGKSVSIDTLDEIYYKKHFAGFGSYL
jgi:cell wall-associated NlpC family hydrolase